MLHKVFNRSFATGPHKFLITGCLGQIGRALIPELQKIYGKDNVVGTDLIKPKDKLPCKFLALDIMHQAKLEKIVRENKINAIVHYAAILSATGEKMPEKAKEINIRGLEHVFDVSLKYKCMMFNASSIAAYGGNFPRENAPEDCAMLPTTIYGISKIYGELLGKYYHDKHGLDYRSLRYPVIISSQEYGYSGTAIYTTEMFFKALKEKKYECYVKPETRVPAIHVDDCVAATLKLLAADDKKLTRRTYNLGGLSFSAGDLAAEIKKHVPDFVCTFKPDFRQAIADTWPKVLNEESNGDWDWKFTQTLEDLVKKVFDEIHSAKK